jgi:hypothetical protein
VIPGFEATGEHASIEPFDRWPIFARFTTIASARDHGRPHVREASLFKFASKLLDWNAHIRVCGMAAAATPRRY